MIEDKQRWNEKYRNFPMPTRVAPVVERFAASAPRGRALDIACGMGRHTLFLAESGFEVDAVDYSDYALERIPVHAKIRTVEADLERYEIDAGGYDLIVNCNYLDRRMYSAVEKGLAPGGMLIFETFLESSGEGYHQPSSPDFVLQEGELPLVFAALECLHYDEREETNLRGEKVRVATFVGRRKAA